MSLKDNAYDQGADDALKNYIDELGTMIAIAEEEAEDVNDIYASALADAQLLAQNMRRELYA